MTNREDKLAKHLRCYKHYAGLARQAHIEMSREFRNRAPGWENRWAYWADIQRSSTKVAASDRARYSRVQATRRKLFDAVHNLPQQVDEYV